MFKWYHATQLPWEEIYSFPCRHNCSANACVSTEQLLLSHQDTSSFSMRVLRCWEVMQYKISLYQFMNMEQLLLSHGNSNSFMLRIVLEGVFVQLFVFQWSQALIMPSRYIFFLSQTWDVESCSGFLFELFLFQWSKARDHVEGIEFNWETVPVDRGFLHHNQRNSRYRIRKINVTELDKYVFQNMEGME